MTLNTRTRRKKEKLFCAKLIITRAWEILMMELFSHSLCVCLCSCECVKQFSPPKHIPFLSFSAISANHHLRIFHLQLFSHMRNIEIIFRQGIFHFYFVWKMRFVECMKILFLSPIKQFCVIFHISFLSEEFFSNSNPELKHERKFFASRCALGRFCLDDGMSEVLDSFLGGGCSLRNGETRRCCRVEYIREGKVSGSLRWF